MEIRIDTSGLRARLGDLAKRQLPFAMQVGLNKTAHQVRTAVQGEMRRVFDPQPTPWILQSVYVNQADRDDRSSYRAGGEMVVEVGFIKPGSVTGDISGGAFVPRKKQDFDTPAAIKAQVRGGMRELKGAENQLRRSGILPMGKYLAPHRAAELDTYGNIPGPTWVKIISDVQGFFEVGWKMNRTLQSSLRRKRLYYVRVWNGVPIGIFKRTGSLGSGRKWSTVTDTPVVNFIDAPTYRQRLDFYGVAGDTVRANAQRNIQEGMVLALKTAK